MKWDLGKLSLSGLLSLDWLFHSGEFIFLLLGAIIETVLGSPELLVAFLSSMNRVADLVPFVPQDLVQQAFTVALVALTALYALRLLGQIASNTES